MMSMQNVPACVHVFVCVYLAVEQVRGHTAEHHQWVFLYRPIDSLSGHHFQSPVVRLIVGRAAFPWLFKANNTRTQFVSFPFSVHQIHAFILYVQQFCTFLLLAWDLDNLLFASFPLLFLSTDYLLVSGSRFYGHLVTKTQENTVLS